VTGVAHLNGAFYYHAWVEYWHDGWQSVDPTWGQLPADLGHIRLAAGGLERQTALFEAFGRLTVELGP
jgi:transglutaminase-like putative cysteine protease